MGSAAVFTLWSSVHFDGFVGLVFQLPGLGTDHNLDPGIAKKVKHLSVWLHYSASTRGKGQTSWVVLGQKTDSSSFLAKFKF